MKLFVWQIVGMENAKEVLLRDIDVLGHRLTSQPRGVLLEGPSGTGKTTLVEAVITYAELTYGEVFHVIRITTGDVSGHVTTTAQKIHELFTKVKVFAKNKVVIVFMDEMEELCLSRGSKKSGHIKNEQTTNFLRELSDPYLQNMYLIGTTNRPKMIDSAILNNAVRIAERVRIEPATRDERRQLIDFYLPTKEYPNVTEDLRSKIVDWSKGDEGRPRDEDYRPWLTWSGSDFLNLQSNLNQVRLYGMITDPDYQITQNDLFHEFTKINDKKLHSMLKDDYILTPD